MIAVGFLLFDWAGCALLLPAHAPYRYELVAEGPLTEFAHLDLDVAVPDAVSIRKYEVRAEADATIIGVAHAAIPDPDSPPILLNWENLTGRPLLTEIQSLSDLSRLAQAVREHVPSPAVVLGWWDTMRQLRFLTKSEVLIDRNLAQPVLVPPIWRDQSDAIMALEREFWQVPSQADPVFSSYVDALLATPQTGALALRALAGNRPAYIVVGLADAYKLGALRADKFGIGYRDFVRSGDVHAEISQVNAWLGEQGYQSYAIDRRSGRSNRIYFLTDGMTEETLLAQMLPFSSSNPKDLSFLRLVANYGGYWVYEIPHADQSPPDD